MQHCRTRIICIGNDPMLSCTRAEILNGAGYRAEWALPGHFTTGHFDVVVACHTLRNEDIEALCQNVTSNETLLLLAHGTSPRALLELVKQASAWSAQPSYTHAAIA